MKEEHVSEIKAIVILALGLILFASLISFVPEDLSWYTSSPNVPARNLIRITGAYIAGVTLFVFGYSSHFLVIFLLFWSWNKFALREIEFSISKLISSLVLFAVVSSFFSITGSQDIVARFGRSGIVGLLFSDFLLTYLGRMGTYIVLITLGVLSLILTGEFLVAPLFLGLVERASEWLEYYREQHAEAEKEIRKKAKLKPVPKPRINIAGAQKKKKGKATVEPEEEDEEEEYEYVYEEEEDPVVGRGKKPQIKIAPTGAKKEKPKQEDQIVGEYTMPSLDLLEDPPEIPTSKIESGLMTGAKMLEETLAQFGVIAKVKDIERGPAITPYELEPAPGMKVQRFVTLSDDIALAMKASVVRVVAPIPGKKRVGVEVPNATSATVFLKDVLSTEEFQNKSSKLTLSLGKDISGMPMVADLAVMPHMLIAGTTGAGKTVCVNGIIMSMLLNAGPDEVKFVMIDPKMVELAQYNDIPHLLCPTVTDPKKAAAVLHWVVGEMESRYRKLSKEGVRNIKGYNQKGHYMPYIVVIVDELADLMQVSAKAVESSITRLAQLSRAVGIHLILATQRPSVDVITGVIKANFPARVSFKVASKVDSRTVLDMNGAEALLGKGDMLFIQPGDAKPTRGQCSFVRDDEIARVISFIKDQQGPVYNEGILKQQKTGVMSGSGKKDEYYDEAVQLVVETGQASVSILQRRMRLGYTRAARLIDMMEQEGIVGPYCGSKARDILVDREQWLLENMNENEDEGGKEYEEEYEYEEEEEEV